MKQLKNNCRYGKISVTPSNWRTSKADITKSWTIVYWFYDDNSGKKKQIRKQGMNDIPDWITRKEITEKIIYSIKYELEEENYNPITKEYYQDSFREISEKTKFSSALDFCFVKGNFSKKRGNDVKSFLKYLKQAVYALRIDNEPVINIRLRHIRQIMDWLAENKENWSNNQFNVYRTTLIKFFSTLEEYEAVLNNFPKKLKKKPSEKTMREVLKPIEVEAVYKYLNKHHFRFWRFMIIFFYSGCRIAELMRVKVKDVDLHYHEFIVKVMKGKVAKEELRAINEVALPLWQEIIFSAESKDDYVFSINLRPGAKHINSDQITKRWYKHIKKGEDFKKETGMAITADFYAFKHLFLDMIADSNDLKTASKAAGHTNIETTKNHYTINQKRRELKEMKELHINLLPINLN